MVYGILTEGLLFFNHEIILENSKMKPRLFFSRFILDFKHNILF